MNLRVASRFEVQIGMELATSTTTATCCTFIYQRVRIYLSFPLR